MFLRLDIEYLVYLANSFCINGICGIVFMIMAYLTHNLCVNDMSDTVFGPGIDFFSMHGLACLIYLY